MSNVFFLFSSFFSSSFFLFFLQEIFITVGHWLMKLYTTPPSILTLVTWVQRTQAWPSANSARRLAFGQTESYSVQPRLPLAATIGPAGRSRVFFYWVRPASLMVGPNYTAQSCPTATLLNPPPQGRTNSWIFSFLVKNIFNYIIAYKIKQFHF